MWVNFRVSRYAVAVPSRSLSKKIERNVYFNVRLAVKCNYLYGTKEHKNSVCICSNGKVHTARFYASLKNM